MPIRRYNGTSWDIIAGDGSQGAAGATGTSALTTKGDILTYDTAPNRLGIGSNNQVLTADSTAALGVKWATPASGSMTQLATGTLSGTTVTLSSISQGYKNLFLLIDEGNKTGTSNFFVNPNGSTTSCNVATVSDGAYSTQNSTINLVNCAQGGLANDTNNSFVVQIINYASTTAYKPITASGSFKDAGGTPVLRGIIIGGSYASTTAVSSLTITGGTFSGGTYTLYGVN